MSGVNELTGAVASAATEALAEANGKLREAASALEAAGGEAAQIGRSCLERSAAAFRDMATGAIDPDIAREVIARELDATSELARGLVNAGGTQLAGFVVSLRRVLIDVGIPLLKIAAGAIA